MAWKRIVYAILLFMAIVAFIVTDSGVALFLCVLLAALPLLSLTMLLIAYKRVRFECDVRESCIRGGALQVNMSLGVSPRFLVGCAKIYAEIENTTFNKLHSKSFLFKDLSSSTHTYDFISDDSGRICVRINRIRLIDIFGICAINIKRTDYAESLVSPVLHDGLNLRLGTNRNHSKFGEILIPERGGDVSEIFNIRDYTPGDALNSVHWKLSSKLGRIQTKEFGNTEDNRILILVDMSRNKFGVIASDEQLNAVLDVAISVSDALRQTGYTHCVGWVDSGVFGSTEVNDGETFVQMVSKLMSIKVGDGNGEGIFYMSHSLEYASFSKIILVSALINSEELKSESFADLTAISVDAVNGDNVVGEIENEGVRVINVPCDNVEAALAACVL